MTTDLVPKLAMEECKIGNSEVKIYGIAKGSGMIFPNMATTLGYVFTDANLPSGILKKLLKKNIETTFNAISCDGDTSTNDMVSFFATKKIKHVKIINVNDDKLKDFDKGLHSVLLNLAKRVAADGEGSSKFVTVNVLNAKTFYDAKKVAFSIANSPLVKTAIAGEDPNWGRIASTVGASGVEAYEDKLSISFDNLCVYDKGVLNFDEEMEKKCSIVMQHKKFTISCDLGIANGEFKSYGCDLGHEYVKINADYRS